MNPLLRTVLVLASSVCAANAQWSLEVGPMYRGDMEVSVRGGSRASDSAASAASSGNSGGLPTLGRALAPDDGTAQILRQFDDGFVGPSAWAWANTGGWTQFFGYDNPSQYDVAADTLTFQRSGTAAASSSRSTTRTRSDALAWGGDQKTDGVGIMATLAYEVQNTETCALSGLIRFGWLEGISANYRDRPAYRQSIERSSYASSIQGGETRTYVYDTLGNPAFPAAPYAQTDPNAVGPMIGDVPTSITPTALPTTASESLIGRSTENVISTVDLEIDAQMFTFQVGPRWMWIPGAHRFSFLIQPAFTMNLLDVTTQRRETFRKPSGEPVASWRDDSDKQTWRAGFGIMAGIQYALSERWTLGANVGYEWVDRYSFNAGPDRVNMDLSGYQGELALGYRF